jgi:hypothetical protein
VRQVSDLPIEVGQISDLPEHPKKPQSIPRSSPEPSPKVDRGVRPSS